MNSDQQHEAGRTCVLYSTDRCLSKGAEVKGETSQRVAGLDDVSRALLGPDWTH